MSAGHILRSAFELPHELPEVARFLVGPAGTTRARERLSLLARFYETSARVPCAHKQSELLPIVREVLAREGGTEGVVMEAGSFKGASAAKLSLACARAGRRLVVFDSFQGIPENDEWMDLADVTRGGGSGRDRFDPGGYRGTREEVERALRRFGAWEVAELVEGWFEDTLPAFTEPVAVAFLDVDLAASTRVCLDALDRVLVPGGVIFSHDGHLPLVREVFAADGRWVTRGMGEGRLFRIERRSGA